MADGTSPVPAGFREGPDAEDLKTVGEGVRAGGDPGAKFLAEGLMNRNWRLDTATGVYALKLVWDVPAEIARRNERELGR